MIPQTEYLEIYRGDDEEIMLQLLNDDGTPIDLRGAVIDFWAKQKASNDIVLKLSSANRDEIALLADGWLKITIAHEKTKDANWKTADYDIQLTDTAGKRFTFLHGVLTLIKDVTQT